MNRENQELIRQQVQKVLEAAPAAKRAIDGILTRLDAPWYVRAWHQFRGDEGWGNGDELILVILSLIWIGLLIALCFLIRG